MKSPFSLGAKVLVARMTHTAKAVVTGVKENILGLMEYEVLCSGDKHPMWVNEKDVQADE